MYRGIEAKADIRRRVMMEEIMLPDLLINGWSKASGGKYRSVKIDGVGKLDSGLICDSMCINGIATVKGDIETRTFEVNGKFKAEGSLIASTVKMDGQVNFIGGLQSEEVKLNGMMKVDGDCEAEKFEVNGGFTIEGLLNAGTVNIQLYGRCKAREIGGERIEVKLSRDHKTWSKMLKWIPAFQPQLIAGTIEGDDLHLEETTADIVRGNRVYIGPNCTIKRVEYRSELFVHENSIVNEQVQG
jgi:cytoskeletal protein CcmA (bactofilin family)